MEKECFEDDEVAGLMNKAFVCIKIDREERPDLDSVYMTVCQIMVATADGPQHNNDARKKSLLRRKLHPERFKIWLIWNAGPHSSNKSIWKSQRADLENLGKELRQKIESFEKETPENELEKMTYRVHTRSFH